MIAEGKVEVVLAKVIQDKGLVKDLLREVTIPTKVMTQIKVVAQIEVNHPISRHIRIHHHHSFQEAPEVTNRPQGGETRETPEGGVGVGVGVGVG